MYTHRWKGRIVFGGDAVKTSEGDWALFNDVGSTPSTMTAARVMIALHACHPEWELLQSDCVRAYIQATLKGPKTFVRLPKEWWPPSWHGKFKDPVVELRLALYGHPAAGDCWHEKIEGELVKLGFGAQEGWPSVYIKGKGTKDVLLFVLYVDDLLMLGGPSLRGVVDTLRKTIDMEDPLPLKKYLGCEHIETKTEIGGDLVTDYKFKMNDYFRSAVEIYEDETGEKTSPVASPYVPDVPAEEVQQGAD